MALSFEQLIGQVTKDQAFETIIDLLEGYGFPARSWESGSVQRTVFEGVALLYSQLKGAASNLARGGHNSYAERDWLTMYSDSQFDNQRFDGRPTQGMARLTDAASSGPYTIASGTVVISDLLNNYRYRNITAGVLPQGGSLSLKFEADAAGYAQNVANGALTVLVQGPPGATVTNPALGSGTWLTRTGTDQESDPSLRLRNTGKWGTLSPAGGPAAAYEYWARQAEPSVRRVYVDPTSVDGTGALTVYIAGDDGSLTSLVVASVQDYIDGTDGVGRRPLGANVTVASATEQVITATVTAYLQPGLLYDDPTRAAVVAAVEAYFKTLPIGGTRIDGLGSGKVLLGRLYHALFSVPGVANVALSLSADVTLAANIVAVPNFTYVFENAY